MIYFSARHLSAPWLLSSEGVLFFSWCLGTLDASLGSTLCCTDRPPCQFHLKKVTGTALPQAVVVPVADCTDSCNELEARLRAQQAPGWFSAMNIVYRIFVSECCLKLAQDIERLCPWPLKFIGGGQEFTSPCHVAACYGRWGACVQFEVEESALGTNFGCPCLCVPVYSPPRACWQAALLLCIYITFLSFVAPAYSFFRYIYMLFKNQILINQWSGPRYQHVQALCAFLTGAILKRQIL